MIIRTRRGFTLLEVLLAVILMFLFVASLVSVLVVEKGFLTQLNHRLEAINYASGVADKLMEIVSSKGRLHATWRPSEFSIGTHTADAICTLPESYFKTTLGGELSYKVDDISLDSMIKACRVEVVVKWKETIPIVSSKEERLTFIAYCYQNTWPDSRPY